MCNMIRILTLLVMSLCVLFFKVVVGEKLKNLRRLEAQRNELNAKGDLLWSDAGFYFSCSSGTKGRTSAIARTRVICRRSCTVNGENKSPRKGDLGRT